MTDPNPNLNLLDGCRSTAGIDDVAKIVSIPLGLPTALYN
jgi:hypothetical protein